MKRITNLLIAILLVIVTSSEASATWHVWTVTQTRRLLRDDPAQDSLPVALSAAKNEWESFQILIRSDTPISEVRVQPGDLHGPAATVLKAADARLFRQHQFHLTIPTYRT